MRINSRTFVTSGFLAGGILLGVNRHTGTGPAVCHLGPGTRLCHAGEAGALPPRPRFMPHRRPDITDRNGPGLCRTGTALRPADPGVRRSADPLLLRVGPEIRRTGTDAGIRFACPGVRRTGRQLSGAHSDIRDPGAIRTRRQLRLRFLSPGALRRLIPAKSEVQPYSLTVVPPSSRPVVLGQCGGVSLRASAISVRMAASSIVGGTLNPGDRRSSASCRGGPCRNGSWAAAPRPRRA